MSRDDFRFFLVFDPIYRRAAKVNLYSIVQSRGRAASPLAGSLVVRPEHAKVAGELARWCDEHLGGAVQCDVVQVPAPILREIDAGFPTPAHFKAENWFRLFAADLGLLDRRSVLYLDADTLVLDDLGLLAADPGAASGAVSAVVDPGWVDTAGLGVPRFEDYFNSGVMRFNTASGDLLTILSEARAFARKHPEKCRFVDQCALNAVLQGGWERLDPRWNYQTSMVGDARFACPSPAIIHYTGGNKPWQVKSRHVFRGHYLDFARQAGMSVFERLDWGAYLDKKKRKLTRLFT